jgi:adenosylcobinamide kinase / adenosylcobinamide-phosphate guanylyltransferase
MKWYIYTIIVSIFFIYYLIILMESEGMGKVILVTGGSRSGKSTFAESILKDKDEVLYIATAVVTDEEMAHRIEMHRKSRNQNWTTYEGYKLLTHALESFKEKYILLDCVTVMVTNLMFDEDRNFDAMTNDELAELEKFIEYELCTLVESVKASDKTIVMVTNEVGMGLVPEYKLGRIFRDIAGRMNQRLGSLSDEVYLVTCGIPLKIK